MNSECVQAIRQASIAGWWTVLIGAIWLTVVWLVWLLILRAKPGWLISLWGGNIGWDKIQSLMITFMAVLKIILFVGVLGCLWLTFWGW